MILEVVVALAAVVALASVTAPLRKGRRPLPDDSRGLAELNERKEAALGAIVDLESELAVGKLSRADFEALRREYENEAVEAMRNLDAADGDVVAGVDSALEDEIVAARRRLECPRCGGPRSSNGRCDACAAP